ncbi:MAG: flavin monoamine oxidase family protein [Hyphomicrobiaceae bacterium]
MGAGVDIAVVGAGAAGLAAGKRLQLAGASFHILEARHRTGGRAWTDTEAFDSLGFDHGCHWLHSASVNPLRAEADRLDVPYLKQKNWRGRLFDRDHWIDEAALKGYERAVDGMFAKVDQLADAGHDVAASEAFDPSAPYLAAIRHLFTQVTSAEPEEVSVVDGADYIDTEEDYPVEHGYGALIQKVAAGVPVSTATPVERIDWSGRTVSVHTPKGNLRARAVIVTASTNALSGGAVRFDPELPSEIVEALEAVPLGCVEKVAFLLDRPIDGVPANSFATIIPLDGLPLYFQINPFGRPTVVAHLGGNTARDLQIEGTAAMIAFARERLVQAFGADIANRIRETTVTSWTSDPFIRGAYANARPGRAGLRARLSAAFSDRLFLAGEATTTTAFATAHGAHETGIRAAERALEAIGMVR